MFRFPPSMRHGVAIAAAYALVGASWIAFSDALVASLTNDERQLTILQTLKGWAFIALSAVLVAVLVHRAVRREENASKALRRSEERFRGFFDDAAVGMAVAGLDGRWLMVNPELCNILGFSADELLALHSLDITPTEDHEVEMRSMSKMVSGEVASCAREKRFLRRDGSPVWVLLSANVVRDSDTGEPLHFIAVIKDITERKRALDLLKAALAEKEVLLGEIHHRVRNNLQLIISLLSIEASKFSDPQVHAAFVDSLVRIEAMGLIHQQLYQTHDFVRVDIDTYVRDLCAAIATVAAPDCVAFQFTTMPIHCPLPKAIPMGIIIVELVLNALKHAFPDGRAGTITVGIDHSNGSIRIQVADDGIGRPPSMAEGTGLTIVRLLAAQLEGRLSMTAGEHRGMRVALELDPDQFAIP